MLSLSQSFGFFLGPGYFTFLILLCRISNLYWHSSQILIVSWIELGVKRIQYQRLSSGLKDALIHKAFDSWWSNAFWYGTVYIFWKSIHRSSPEMFLGKGVLKIYSKLTHRIFYSQFLYDLKRKVRLSESVCGILHFRFRFSWTLLFCSKKSMDCLTLKR